MAHAGTTEQSMFVPIPFPPLWLIFTDHKCSACLAQEAGAFNFILLTHAVLTLTHTLFTEDHLRVATENGADDRGPEDKVKTRVSKASTFKKYSLSHTLPGLFTISSPSTPTRIIPPGY